MTRTNAIVLLTLHAGLDCGRHTLDVRSRNSRAYGREGRSTGVAYFGRAGQGWHGAGPGRCPARGKKQPCRRLGVDTSEAKYIYNTCRTPRSPTWTNETGIVRQGFGWERPPDRSKLNIARNGPDRRRTSYAHHFVNGRF
jgi:hypothetical protein